MNEIIFDICITAVSASLFSLLIPNEKFSRQIKLLLSCFFIVTVVGNISGGSVFREFDNIFVESISYNDYTAQINNMTSESIAQNMRIAVKEKLCEINIVPEKIVIDINISDIGSISINEIKIYMNNEDYKNKSESAIQLIKEHYKNKINVKAEVGTI